jgi:pimeloyl-ACP methyl ester carboxylesterase
VNKYFDQCQIEEHTVPAPGGGLPVTLISPPAERLSPRPALALVFAADRQYSLFGEVVVALTTQLLLDAGHRVLTFDLPQHGARVDEHGEGIGGLCAAYLAGHDPFAEFLGDAAAVLDHAAEAGWARSGNALVGGYSRGAYFALRLLAAEPRVQAAALFAPVTDWRDLREFAAERERPEVAALALANDADALAGRPVYLAIGHADGRVGTASCCRLFLALHDANARRGVEAAPLVFHCTDDLDHTLGAMWYARGVDFLLKHYRGV